MLLLAFALQTFNQALLVFDYQINTQSYSKDCENKARPQLHCNGQCKLMKKLKKEAEKDQRNPERKVENRNEIVLFNSSFQVNSGSKLFFLNSLYKPFIAPKVTDRSFTFFHPPSSDSFV